MQPKLSDLKRQGVDLYVFASGSKAENKQFFTRNQIQATVIYDGKLDIGALFGVTAIPETFLMDKQGRVAAGMIGWEQGSYDQDVLPLIQALLKE